MKLLQGTPSISSPAGILTMLVGVAVSMFLLSQWDRARRFVGLTAPGQI